MLTLTLSLLPHGALGHGAPRKNVLFLAADDMRIQLGTDRVPGTHAMHTPVLDKLVGESLFLRKAQVQQAVCSPTRTSLLTSRYPDTTRVWDLVSYFRDVGGNFTTIPQLFREHGYRTYGMGKIFHPGAASGADPQHGNRGDDAPYSWSEPYFHAPNLMYWDGARAPVPGCAGCGDSNHMVSPEAERAKPLPDSQTAAHAVGTLANLSTEGVGRNLSHPASTPFFVAVGFHKPHLPFYAPDRFFDLYPQDEIELPADQLPPKRMPPIAWSAWGELRNYNDISLLNNSGAPGETLPPRVTKALRRAYYASLSFTDFNIGLVLSALEAHGYAENTVVSFWGDHGWQLGEHGEWCKHTNFDVATNAPMLVRIPGLTDGGVSTSTPTEFLDLMPTLAEAAMGVAVPPCPAAAAAARKVKLCTHGTSLLPLVSAPTVPVKVAAYSQYPRGHVGPHAEGRGMPELASLGADAGLAPSACLAHPCTMGYSVLTSISGVEYRYTEWVDFNTKVSGGPDWGRNVGTELYDHADDPLENVNIAPTVGVGLLRQLSGVLRAHPVWAATASDPPAWASF